MPRMPYSCLPRASGASLLTASPTKSEVSFLRNPDALTKVQADESRFSGLDVTGVGPSIFEVDDAKAFSFLGRTELNPATRPLRTLTAAGLP